MNELHMLSNIRIPRCYFEGDRVPINTQIHGFCDASERAYAAVVYIRCTYGDNCIYTRLVVSKSKVAPVKKQTIPRLELLGALILARLLESVTPLIPHLNELYCWTDSMTVLWWLSNKRMYKQYVRHRIDEIRQLTNHCSWRHCPGKLNPADLPSRGVSIGNLVNLSLWWEGPRFLQAPEHSWPPEFNGEFSEAARDEIVKQPPNICHSLLALEREEEKRVGVCQILNAENYRSLNLLFRTTACVLRFIDNLKKDKVSIKSRRTLQFSLEAKELQNAETVWIRSIQSYCFQAEICFLKQQTAKKSLLVDQFQLFLDDQKLIRCKGRLNNALLSLNCKTPVLLPSKMSLLSC